MSSCNAKHNFCCVHLFDHKESVGIKCHNHSTRFYLLFFAIDFLIAFEALDFRY